MAICYNVENARKAFNGLAETLDAVSRLPLSRPEQEWEPDMDREEKERILENLCAVFPDTGEIGTAFKDAKAVAHTARDTETEKALGELSKELEAAFDGWTKGNGTESDYKAQLANVAASVRGLLVDIAEDGTKKTARTQPPPARVTAELAPKYAALLTKAADHSAAERAAASIDEIKGKMLALWRRWLYNEPYNPERTRETPPAEQKLCAAMNDAAFAYWKAFQNGELDGTLSVQEHDKYIAERAHKRSATEFFETHGRDVVWTAHDGKQYTLQELCPTVEDVQRMIDRNNKAIRRAGQKNGQSADKKKI